MAGSYDENNSTVRWVPRFLRRFLGLDGDFEQPRYEEDRNSRKRYGADTVGWVLDPARRALGLNYEEPKRYAPSSTPYRSDQPISAVRETGRPAEPIRRVDMPSAPPRAALNTPVPDRDGRLSFGSSEERMRDIASQASYTPTGSSGTRLTPGANLPNMPQTEGYVQPISFLLRGYARGSLPPQGLEQFTKELRGTGRQLWEFYEYWIRFQTDDLGRLFRSTLGGGPLRPITTPTSDLDEQFQHVPVEISPPTVSVPLVTQPTSDVAPPRIVTPPIVPPADDTLRN